MHTPPLTCRDPALREAVPATLGLRRECRTGRFGRDSHCRRAQAVAGRAAGGGPRMATWPRGPAWPRVAAGAARSVAKTAPQLPSSPCCPCAWVPRPLRRPVPLAARCTLCSFLFPCVVGLRCPGAIPRPHSPAEGGSQPLPGSLGQEPETGGQTGVHTDGRTCAGASP